MGKQLFIKIIIFFFCDLRNEFDVSKPMQTQSINWIKPDNLWNKPWRPRMGWIHFDEKSRFEVEIESQSIDSTPSVIK